MKNKKIFKILFAFLFAFLSFFPVHSVFSAVTSTCDTEGDLLGLGCVGQNSGLSDRDPRIIIVNIINVSLGLLGIVFTVLMVYAGFLWMTAGGDEGKTETARKIIFAAIIGLVIILMSFAITKFVSSGIYSATNGTQNSQYYYYEDSTSF